MTEPVTIPERFGVPYHGLCVGGILTLPNAATIAHAQPAGAGTVIVGSPSPPADTRDLAQQQADAVIGRQWLSYALLSGRSKTLAGKAVDPTGAQWPTRRTGRWIYHDGETAWWMRWDITPDRRYNVASPYHMLAITVEKPFGLFGNFPPTWTENELLNTRLAPDLADYYDTTDPEVYIALHSQDGSKSVVNLCWAKNIGCQIYFDDFLTIYPWTSMTPSGDGRWLATIFSGYSYFELTLSGKGSRDAATMGQGITVSAANRQFIAQYDDDGDDYYELNEHIRTVSPSGDFASWFLDDVALKVKCGTINEAGHFVQALGPDPENLPRIADFTVDSCYDTLSTTAPNIGVKLIDGWGLQAKTGTADWAMLHLQAGPPGANGVSYDIANDEWSDTADSCYV